MINSTYNIIAVMSGTSLDGIDLIYATYEKDSLWNFKIHYAETVKYSKEWKTTLSNLVNQKLDQLKVIDFDYSEFLASTILDFIKKYKIEAVDFIASHGHTALHQPEKCLTYQIGNLQSLADILSQKVICDFRVQDVELGGQGAPLVPIGDRLLFNEYDYCINLGGFANISSDFNNERIAFDICPVNIVLNYYVSQIGLEFDDNGQLASTGKINENLLLELNALHFYNEIPPKSLGLEWVDLNIFPLIDSYNLKLEDILCTYIEHISIQISTVIIKNTTKVLVTGGGVYNGFLINRINHYLNNKVLIPSDQIVEFKEALIFGLLGALKERDEVNCLMSVTGASHDHSSGKILIPKN
ncbi:MULTISPECIES: anhydro-N-acetylmuramic acid kinase [Winogradskyella]|uniref:anhydro-N-acetylmuramic acid kinase n=1 Tax=Winogradskyella TaxID=286104 RepID=UPI0015CD5BE0|nr:MULTISPECIES: anhydro-N-acetylmuramic acid kinase [Winogradskyella]QXP77800.1 anhydro-N-acetylmuramic acid kinase [Winogradskyella sp. HaHa_3_26]